MTLIPTLQRIVLIAGCLLPIVATAAADETDDTHAFDPVVLEIRGWKVHVDPAMIDHPEGERAIAMLENHLQRIEILVADQPLAKLKTIGIWIERNHPSLHAMQYHPSRGWLIANGHDERLTKKVHVPNASQLLSKSQMLQHPAVILHELAHGYHDQYLGFDNPEIMAVFEKAQKAKNYERVLDHTGRQVRHYGLNNCKEYFAEGTEAFFYRNDFYPFVRAELQEHDPGLHELLMRAWDEPR